MCIMLLLLFSAVWFGSLVDFVAFGVLLSLDFGLVWM